MITASEAAKLAYDKNYSSINSKEQFAEIEVDIEAAAKDGKHYITVKFLTGDNHNKLKSDFGYTVINGGLDTHTIQW